MMTVAELIKELQDLTDEEQSRPVTVAARSGARFQFTIETGVHSGVVLVPVGDPVNYVFH